MNAIEKAISDVKFRIPKAILTAAFMEQQGYGGLHQRTVMSLDYRIREEVINNRVMQDCNLVGGTEVTIPLGDIVAELLPERRTVWRIPLSLTQNRKIIRVYSLVVGTGRGASAYTPFSPGGSIEAAAIGLLATSVGIPDVSHAEVKIIGENTVMANYNLPYTSTLFLRCVLENDSEFNNLPPSTIPRFSKLVEFATKSYVYNKLILDLDQARLSGGQELGRFLSIVEEYADAEELYQEEFQERWRKVAIFADDQARKRHLKYISGGRY